MHLKERLENLKRSLSVPEKIKLRLLLPKADRWFTG